MPTYGYQCTQCQGQFDVFQKMSDAPVSSCPKCSGAVKRLFYPVGIVFKGSGWYINDSRKPEKSGDSEGAKSENKVEAAKEATSGDSSAESKPAATDAKPATPATS